MQKFTRENHKLIEGFTQATQNKLVNHRWAGNMREFENAVERAVVLSEGSQIDEADLPFDEVPVIHGAVRIPGATMAEIEKYAILSTLDAMNVSTTLAAGALDISVRTLQYRWHDHGTCTASMRA